MRGIPCKTMEPPRHMEKSYMEQISVCTLPRVLSASGFIFGIIINKSTWTVTKYYFNVIQKSLPRIDEKYFIRDMKLYLPIIIQ